MTGHRSDAQGTSLPWYVPPCRVQSAAVTSRQVALASAMQHAPVGCGQVVVEQLVPMPWYVPEHVSPGSSTVPQVPSGLQQAPMLPATLNSTSSAGAVDASAVSRLA